MISLDNEKLHNLFHVFKKEYFSIFRGRSSNIFMSSFVFIAALLFLFYGFSFSDKIKSFTSYKAILVSSEGLEENSDVMINGIIVGHIKNISLNADQGVSNISFLVNKSIHIPIDSSLSVGAPTPLSPMCINIIVGQSKSIMPEDYTITNTQAYETIEQKIGNFIFGSDNFK